jgi:hypothetical protein
MKTTALPRLLLSVSFLLILMGCKKDFEFDRIKPPQWTPDIAIPLVDDEITFEQALKVSGSTQNYYIDDNGDISILYYFNNNAFQMSVNDLLAVPSLPFAFDHQVTSQEQQLISMQDVTLPPVSYTFDLAQDYPDVRVDRLLVKKGSIIVHINNTFSNNGQLVVNIPNATKNGIAFSHRIGPLVAGNSTDTIDLANVQFDLTSTQNRLGIQVEGQFRKSSRPVANDRIHADFTIGVQGIEKFEGYLGHRVFTPGEASVMVTAFHNAYALGNVYFIDPRASITMVNSFGIPMKITVTELKGTNLITGQYQDITDRLGSSATFMVPSPAMNSTEPASSVIDYTNANTVNGMELLFSVKPDNVYYRITTEINPAGRATNFFTDTSSIYANLQVKLPLYGHFDNLTVQDTFDFSIGQNTNIESMIFHTAFVNGFPLSARMQLYFTDQGYHKIDSLTGGNSILIREAPVDPATHLPFPDAYERKDTSFFFDRSRVCGLANAHYILVKAVLNSNDGGKTNVKIKATQKLKVHFSAEARLTGEDLGK